jgi:ribose transport system substrate-binding protein
MSLMKQSPSRRALLAAAAKVTAILAAEGGIGNLASWKAFAAEVGDPRQKHFKVISQVYTLNNVYWSNWEKGAAEAAAALGVKNQAEVDNENDDKVQTIFRTAKSRGFDGITSSIADPGISRSILTMAQSEGVYVANGWNLSAWLTPFDIGDYYYSFTTPNDVAGARALAAMLFVGMGGQGQFIHITGIPGNTVDINRTVGVNEALKQFPGIKLVARQPGGFDRGHTTPVIDALLTAHPHVKGIFCQNDDSAMGVIAALQARRTKALPLVTGIDAIPDMLDAIANKRAFATWGHHGAYMGARTMVQVFDALAGVKISAPERMMYSGGFVINTPEAAVAYKKVMFGGGAFPFDYSLMSKALHPNDWDPQNTLAPLDFKTYFARQQPRPINYKTPQAYADAVKAGEVEKVAMTYREHFKKDPLANVRQLCAQGGKDIV